MVMMLFAMSFPEELFLLNIFSILLVRGAQTYFAGLGIYHGILHRQSSIRRYHHNQATIATVLKICLTN